MRAQFDASKRWWTIGATCRLSVVGIGIISTLTSLFAEWLGLLAAFLTVAYVLFQWYSDYLRDTAETILRKIELYDGLGWPITSREIVDLLLTVPKSVKAQASTSDDAPYFESKTALSPLRMLENLEESTWMTKHQAKRMGQYVSWLSALVFMIAAIALITSLQNAANQTVATNVAKITIAVIVFMFSGGYVRLAFNYYSFARQTEQIENNAHRMTKESNITEIQVVKLLHDYQIIRAKAPMLPSWLWRYMQNELNRLWQAHRQEPPPAHDQAS